VRRQLAVAGYTPQLQNSSCVVYLERFLINVHIDSSSSTDAPDVLRYAEFDNPLGDGWPIDRVIAKTGVVVLATDIGKESVEKVCRALRAAGHRVDWVARENKTVIKTLDCPNSIRAIWRTAVLSQISK